MKKHKTNILITMLIVTLIAIYPTMYYSSSKTVEITVTDKERITTGSGQAISSKFLIYTETGVYENTDSWLYMKFNSADFQQKFEVGETYTVKVAGWRMPFFSWYKNVVKVD